MRTGVFVVGIVVAVIGSLFAVAYVDSPAVIPEAIPAGLAAHYTPPGYIAGSSPVTIAWTGAPSDAIVYLTTGLPSCAAPPVGLVASGQGSSGSLSATVTAGSYYWLYECDNAGGTTIHVTFRYPFDTDAVVFGVVLLAIGALLIVIGLRSRRRPRAAPS